MKRISLLLFGMLLCMLVACKKEEVNDVDSETNMDILITVTPVEDGLENKEDLDNSEDYDDLWEEVTPTPLEEATPTPDGELEITNTVTPSVEAPDATNTPTPTKDKDETKLPELTKEAVEVPTLSPTTRPEPTKAGGVTMAPVEDDVVATVTPTPTTVPTMGEDESGLGDEDSAPLDDLNWGPLIPM